MTVEELRAHCEKNSYLYVVLPWVSKGERIRLCQTHGPLGTILNERNGETTACFDSAAILKWLAKNNA